MVFGTTLITNHELPVTAFNTNYQSRFLTPVTVFDTRLTHSCSRNNLMNMSNLLDDIQVKVATLSAEERAALALRLIESLDAESSPQTEDRAELVKAIHVPRSTNNEQRTTNNERSG